MISNELIEKLEKFGFKRWTKGDKDRLYINASDLGLECSYYNTGTISGATFNGERISNSLARSMKFEKTYIDVATGNVFSTREEFRDIAEKMLAEAEKDGE